ncbi:substrate-binding domain-containing protein [Sellimonas sp.]|uniref:substrate-binding domain-containing protein n=1 Tax=Sellimonas sp. TaxID=2021466 RepID=UPI0025803E3F|nr:substrate-binding domain-containing protein [Sellimonas sp.]
MKKKVVTMLLAGLMTVALAACSVEGESSGSGGGGNSSTNDGEVGKVGFSISTLNNPFFVSMADGAEAKAEEMGIDLTVVDAGNDTAKQSSDIEDLIATGIEVLIVNPEDSASVAPAVSNAISQGIKVIAVDRTVDGADVDCYIGTDNVAAGELAGNYLVDHLESGDQIAILEGIPGASSAIDRDEGFHNAVDGKLEVVSSQTANYDRAEGLTVTENVLQANPDIKAILAANDEMALGAIEAVEAAGKEPGKDILVTGFDAGDDAIQSVKDGKMLFTVEQQTTEMGQMAVESAEKMMKGEEVDSNIPIEVTLLDSEGVKNMN